MNSLEPILVIPQTNRAWQHNAIPIANYTDLSYIIWQNSGLRVIILVNTELQQISEQMPMMIIKKRNKPHFIGLASVATAGITLKVQCLWEPNPHYIASLEKNLYTKLIWDPLMIKGPSWSKVSPSLRLQGLIL